MQNLLSHTCLYALGLSQICSRLVDILLHVVRYFAFNLPLSAAFCWFFKFIFIEISREI